MKEQLTKKRKEKPKERNKGYKKGKRRKRVET